MLNNDELNKEQNNTALEITIESDNEKEVDTALDLSTSLIPLEDQAKKIVQQIVAAPTQRELQEQFDLFNMNQSKKDALRIIKLNNLLDKVEDQAIERFEKRPDMISNKELLEYMQVVATQIDRSQKRIDNLQQNPPIKAIQNNTQVNVNIGTDFDRDSKERVLDAIQALLKQAKSASENQYESEIIDIDTVDNNPEETVESINNSEENTEKID